MGLSEDLVKLKEPPHAASTGGPQHPRYFRLIWWCGVLLAVAVPISLFGTVGIVESLRALRRYTAATLEFSRTRAIHVPSLGDPERNYTRTDQDLIEWQTGMTALYERVSRMAVVGEVTDSDRGLEFQYNPAPGGKKGVFHAKRDLTLLLYLALSAATYLSKSMHLALVVLVLNLANVAICFRLKGLGDAITGAVGVLEDAQQAFLLLPMEGTALELAQQQLCLTKMTAIAGQWSGVELGISVTLPLLGSLTISTSLMASLAAATSVRAMHVIIYGFIPGLPRIHWRALLGMAGEAKAKIQRGASALRQRSFGGVKRD